MFDINKPKYELRDSYTIPLLDPLKMEPIEGVELELIAPRLPEFKKALEAEKANAEDGEDNRIAYVVAGVKSWKGFTDGKKDAPCNAEARRAFFAKRENEVFLAQAYAVLTRASTFLASASES
jgi:hypothetical protein